MRKPITVRVEPELLAEARRCAIGERTLTNLIGVPRRRTDETTLGGPARRHPPRHTRTGQADAA